MPLARLNSAQDFDESLARYDENTVERLNLAA
jgi:hypothetical protein